MFLIERVWFDDEGPRRTPNLSDQDQLEKTVFTFKQRRDMARPFFL